jgi:hypothetical protein
VINNQNPNTFGQLLGNFQRKQIVGDSKMATTGRKQKACFLKYNLGETLEIHLPGKTTEKRQNSDSFTPLAAHSIPTPC